MEITFTDEARELIKAGCFVGDEEAAFQHLGPILLERADNFGRTQANIAGREIRLRVVLLNGDKAIIGKVREDA